MTLTGPANASLIVDYDLDNTRANLTAYKDAKVQAFQATVTNYTAVSETLDPKTQTWKIMATFRQGGIDKRAYLFVDYPKPRGFLLVLSTPATDFAGLQASFDQVLASWQVPAIVK